LNNATVISPPLTITEDETIVLLARLDSALAVMESHIDEWVVAERTS
jgi:hypothetical protein